MGEVDALFDQAVKAFEGREYKKARELLLQLLTIEPSHDRGRKALKGTLIRIFQQEGERGRLSAG